MLHQSEFESPGKAGTGDVFLIELEDGSRVIRFENLDVSNGPDLRVILSPSELVDDRDAYHVIGFYDLGVLKGNQGNQNYEIPDESTWLNTRPLRSSASVSTTHSTQPRSAERATSQPGR